MALRVRIEGLNDIRRLIAKNDRKVIAATKMAVTEQVVELGRKSDELVPFDTGNLMRSQTLKLPTAFGKRITGSVSYGGSAAPYALKQHEDLELWHPPKPPGKSKVGKRQGTGPVAPGQGRGPKYLEYPFNKMKKTFARDITKYVKQALGGYGAA